MRRKRRDDSLRLPERMYARRGKFFYVHADTGRWENLGVDLVAARKRAEHYNDATGTFGTMVWFLDQFLLDCEQRVKAKTLAQRTLDDYRADSAPLKVFFGHLLPIEITPDQVHAYLDAGAKHGRGVRANREKACLSSCLSWMMRTGQAHGGLKVNPCMRASGVRRNAESQRERYVTNEEYLAVYKVAPKQVRTFMELVYTTLQRPESDMIRWKADIVKRKGDERVLNFRQEKTGQWINIGLAGRLAELVDDAIGAVPVLHQPIVHTREGEEYTYTGLSAMLRRAIVKVRETVPALKDMEGFGFRDLKGKGATDMWLAGVPIERIQLLCGHKTKTTTEKYIKARWRETAQPNTLKIA